MRLTPAQTRQITECIHHHLGDAAQVWLFGSRLEDNKRGGDVDIYVETGPHPIMNELRCKMNLEETLDMPIDLIVRRPDEDSSIALIAKTEGVAL
ncbi:MAG: nucleotidyltransferase domain-containing protein [Hydrogenophilales bacterium CG_4_10_14_3_um_filter_58_23]|nr:MAG: DNA polymerase subunit beta [Hydrogenophilales bacterium CG18_big_fil_WC_8_21_14_2_50_58_12]PIX99623.1 MAG: nucleotidyltransferase domain-containing protein [Hydrogenophilales bacterium CG_4_10_14_3_um_filter_58_23]